MAEKGLVNKSTLNDIADAIRAKLNSSETMLPGEMAALIESIICPDVSKVTAAAGDVLSGKVFVDANGNAVTGTMANRGAVNTTVAAGGTYTIPAGYHNGSGKVTSAASTGYKYVTGSVTPTSSKTTLAVTHSLGKTPAYAVVFTLGYKSSSYNQLNASGFNGAAILSSTVGQLYIWSSAGDIRGYTTNSVTLTSSTATFKTSGNYFAQVPYYYIIVG